MTNLNTKSKSAESKSSTLKLETKGRRGILHKEIVKNYEEWISNLEGKKDLQRDLTILDSKNSKTNSSAKKSQSHFPKIDKKKQRVSSKQKSRVIFTCSTNPNDVKARHEFWSSALFQTSYQTQNEITSTKKNKKCRRIVVPVNIPPTLTIATNKTLIWIHSKGKEMSKIQIFNHKSNLSNKTRSFIIRSFLSFAQLKSSEKSNSINNRISEFPIAIVKQLSNANKLLYTTKKLTVEIDRLLSKWCTQCDSKSNPSNHSITIQHFIICKGSNAWKLRSLFQKEAYLKTSSLCAYIYKDKGSLITNSMKSNSCCISKSLNKTSWMKPHEYTLAISDVVEKSKKGHNVTMMAADFILNASNIWWCLQVKGLKIEEERKVIENEVKSHKKAPDLCKSSQEIRKRNALRKCAGEYCKESILTEITNSNADAVAHTRRFSICYKDIALDRFNRKRVSKKVCEQSLNDSNFDEMFYSQLNEKDKRKLYNTVEVCHICYSQYQKQKNLIIKNNESCKDNDKPKQNVHPTNITSNMLPETNSSSHSSRELCTAMNQSVDEQWLQSDCANDCTNTIHKKIESKTQFVLSSTKTSPLTSEKEDKGIWNDDKENDYIESIPCVNDTKNSSITRQNMVSGEQKFNQNEQSNADWCIDTESRLKSLDEQLSTIQIDLDL